MNNTENLETEDIKEIEEAELMAASDNAGEEKKSPEEILQEIRLIHKFKKPYVFEGKEYKELDLSGIENLTATDAKMIDRILTKKQVPLQGKVFQSAFTEQVAIKATGLPIEFFDSMNWKEFEEIKSIIAAYFLF